VRGQPSGQLFRRLLAILETHCIDSRLC